MISGRSTRSAWIALYAGLRDTSHVRTKLTTSPVEAALYIRSGGIVAFPTETVYGLGADLFSEAAVAKIFEAKGRPADNPLIAHVASPENVELLSDELTRSADAFIKAFWPGPLTIVLKRAKKVPTAATAGLDTVGIRMPRHPMTHEFLMACGTPVAAPSANLSGRPSPTTWKAVLEDLDGRIDCILQGDPSEVGIESTVVDCTPNAPVVLRSGSVSLEQLREVIPETRLHDAADLEAPRSPGLKHRHYSPHAAVIIGTGDSADPSTRGYIGLSHPKGKYKLTRVCSDAEEYASTLFEFFRECDRAGIQTIECQPVSETGIGTALMDRIRRSAER